jgi:hypothetical protein
VARVLASTGVLTFVNTARAPFDGAGFAPERAREAADLDGLLPYLDVMQFRVVAGPSARRAPPRELANDLMHIHLGSFQPLARHPITVAIPEDGVADCEITALVRRQQDARGQARARP